VKLLGGRVHVVVRSRQEQPSLGRVKPTSSEVALPSSHSNAPNVWSMRFVYGVLFVFVHRIMINHSIHSIDSIRYLLARNPNSLLSQQAPVGKLTNGIYLATARPGSTF
jgi:hypothetical protein